MSPSPSPRASCSPASRRCSAAPARGRARRSAPDAEGYGFGQWVLRTGDRELVDQEGVAVPLSTGEYNLLHAFVTHPRRVLTRDQLLDLAQGRELAAFERSVDNQVSRLRRKIEGGRRRLQADQDGVGRRLYVPRRTCGGYEAAPPPEPCRADGRAAGRGAAGGAALQLRAGAQRAAEIEPRPDRGPAIDRFAQMSADLAQAEPEFRRAGGGGRLAPPACRFTLGADPAISDENRDAGIESRLRSALAAQGLTTTDVRAGIAASGGRRARMREFQFLLLSSRQSDGRQLNARIVAPRARSWLVARLGAATLLLYLIVLGATIWIALHLAHPFGS